MQHGKSKCYSKAKQRCRLKCYKERENKSRKFSWHINKVAIKESKVSNTEEIFENDDTLSYIDSMYEVVK